MKKQSWSLWEEIYDALLNPIDMSLLTLLFLVSVRLLYSINDIIVIPGLVIFTALMLGSSTILCQSVHL